MFRTYTQSKDKKEKGQGASDFLLKKADVYLNNLLQSLDAHIDKRLVRTFYDLFMAVLIFRNRSNGLLLSELGGYICGFSKAPAGTKRISNLLRSKKWGHELVDTFLFSRAHKRISDMHSKGLRPLMLWDDSRIEKAESWFVEGLCSVWSSKGKRLTKIKRGFFKPPTSRICVPGFKWTAAVVSHLGGVPSVCLMHWWTTRGKYKSDGDNVFWLMLQRLKKEACGVLHVLDRGYASAKVIDWMLHFEQDFLVRWKKNHLLVHQVKGKKKTHLLARSFKAKAYRIIKDKERNITRSVSVAWAAVNHPEFPDKQFFMVILRDKNGKNPPIYFLTSLPIENKKNAWEICASYMHRWEIEQAFRFCKSELAMESPRLWLWENRLKLLALVCLVYDFLLSLLTNWRGWAGAMLRQWGHRTGNRYRNASIPIYRLRAAISVCLLSLFFQLLQNSG